MLNTLIKKFATKLKNFLGNKSKASNTSHAVIAKGIKIPPRKTKVHQNEKSSITETQPKVFRKETREEYRLRHEKLLIEESIETQSEVKFIT